MSVQPDEKHAFQAEVSRLLDIVTNALYSNREVFLRELISNASDACDRLRYAALSAPELLEDEATLSITLSSDKAASKLVVADLGIGMDKEDLIENLGTIARSGTLAFMEQLGEQSRKDVDLIGQFGVGFYAAFMVADKVEVFTRKAGEEQTWHWQSDGRSGYEIAEASKEDHLSRSGTRIELHLKEDAKDFLEQATLGRVVKTYSDHIAVPILFAASDAEPQRLNGEGALWTRSKGDISEQQYEEFYHDVAQAFDKPWHHMHFKAEGVIEYSGLLYVPSSRPVDLFDPARKSRVKLYVKRVFITDDCQELLPGYLRFLRGVIDSEDLPLNISRELLQHNPVLAKIKAGLTKRVLGELEKKATKDSEAYSSFWESFGPVLKEGIYEDEAERERLVKISRFRSSSQEGWVSLDDYIARMKPNQKAIYTLTGDDLDQLKRSPQLEGFLAKGVEVLLLNDPVDEFWVPQMASYQDLPFKSITRGGADLEEIEAAEESKEGKEDAPKAEEKALATFIALAKQALGEDVKEVRVSNRLTDSPVCLVADDGDMDLHLERLLRQHKELGQSFPRVLELNPKHPLIISLSERAKSGGGASDLEEAAHLLFDQARILEGEGPKDPAAFSRRLAQAMAKGFGN